MGISDEIIDTIRERTDVVELVGRYVSLKKQGRDYVGVCPFHSEKTPSFSVSPSKGFYYCFGCHAHGDVFSFVMRYEGLSFGDSARKLAESVGVQVEARSPQSLKREKQAQLLADVNALSLAFFEHQLWADVGREARAYLKYRAIPEGFARERRLGFGGASAELFAYFDKKNVSLDLAARAGLFNEERTRCLFDGRFVFPIFDEMRRVVGFGGRRMVEGKGPKYINTRESPIFNKSRLLYGWDQAQAAVRRSKRVVIVEGYTDVLACHRAGVLETVAALGTAFTSEHAKLCARLAKTAVIVLDGDAAGQRASQGVARSLLNAGQKTLVSPLPGGDDPDSFMRSRGPDVLKEHIDGARPAVEYFIEAAFARSDMSIEDRSEAAAQLAPLIQALRSGLERDLYMAQLAERVGVSTAQLQRHITEALARQKKHQKPFQRASPDREPTPRPTGNSRSRGPFGPPVAPEGTGQEPTQKPMPTEIELGFLRELLLFPELRLRFGELADFALSDPMRDLLTLLETSEDPIVAVLEENLPDRRWVAILSRVEPARAEENEGDEDLRAKSLQTFEDVLARLKRCHLEQTLQEVVQRLSEIEEPGEKIEELIRRKQELKRSIDALGARV